MSLKISLKITQVDKASVKITVRKTGKTYHRTMNYAKHITKGEVGKPKTHEYFLREGRGWKPVSEEAFKEATSKEAVQKLHDELSEQLKHRVEKMMFGEGV